MIRWMMMMVYFGLNACFMSFKMSGGLLEIPVNRLQQEASIFNN